MANQQLKEEIKATAEARKLREIGDKIHQGNKLQHLEIVDYTSMDGNHYEGKILFKKVSVMDAMRIGGIKNNLLKDAGVTDLRLLDPGINVMSTIVSTLDVVMVKRPEWIKNPKEVTDIDLLYHVYDLYEKWQDSFRSPNKTTPEANSTASESAETMAD